MNGRSLIHAPQCNPESSTLRGNYSARLSFGRRLSLVALALISAANAFAATTFKPLPFTDPFPPAAQAGAYSQPTGSVILNEPLISAPFTRPCPTGWENGIEAITVEWWMKQRPQGTPNTSNPQGAIVRGPGFIVAANFQYGNSLDGTGPGGIEVNFSHVKAGAYVGNRGCVILLQPSDEQWHHYVVTYDLHVTRTYMDGELVDHRWHDNNTDRIGPIDDDNGTMLPGVIDVGGFINNRFQNGFLESIRVSNVALTPWQIRRNFENGRTYAKTLYVAAGAPDSGAGTQSAPTSLRTALGRISANTQIILKAGTYSGADFQITRAASSKRDHCLITGEDGAVPAIISGGAPALSGAHYLYLRNLTFSTDSGNALSVNNSTSVTIDSCRFSGNQNGLVANGSSKIVVQNCVANVGNIGVRLATSANSVVRNNTIVNGAVGIQLDAGSSSATLLNNLLSGQNNASLVVDSGAQQWYRGNGNLYNPSSGTAARINGTSYTTAQVRNKSLAQTWYVHDTNDVSDPAQYRAAHTAEANSMAFAPTFVDTTNGDFRLAANLANAIDAGVERTFQRPVIPPVSDAQGTARPLGNAVDVGAYETIAPAYATFILDKEYTTSAGVFKNDGTLVRTLFSGQRRAAGTNVVFWNGLDDNNQPAPTDTYTIKMIAHNVQYVWQNVVGNSSVPNSGECVHNGFEPIKAMAFAGTTAFYTSGYNENHYELNRFDTSNPSKLTKIFGVKSFLITPSVIDVAADETRLYAMDWDASVSVYNQANLGTVAQTIRTGGGNAHVEVQRDGNLLFVAKKSANTISIYDKNSGLQSGSISVDQPGDLATTASGDLWVVTGTATVTYPSVSLTTGNGAARYAVSSTGGTRVQTLTGLQNPIAIACSPLDGTVLVADAGTSQIKAFSSAGSAIWTYGQAGGFANGPKVTADKFYWVFIDQRTKSAETFLQFQPDGTWWVGDTYLSRSLHFDLQRQLLHEIDYQPHSYMASVDPNNPSRVFNRFTEYRVDYSKPPQSAWTITNFWGFNPPLYPWQLEDGLCSVVTLTNNRTYALTYDTNDNGSRVLVELTPNGLRETSIHFGGYTRIQKDGSIYDWNTTASTQTFRRRPLTGFTATGDPIWGSATALANAPVSNGFLTSDPLTERFPLQTSSGLIVSFDPARERNGYHLGALKPGTGQWLWRAMPSVGGLDGRGCFDSWVRYGGNYHVVSGRNIFAGFHGEFYLDAGQTGQFMHYYDNGLFVGQFGQPLLYGVVANPPGGAGNNFNPSLVEVGTNVYIFHNDEAGRGSHRWKAEGISDIKELTANITVGEAPNGTNTVPLPRVSIAATTKEAFEGGGAGVFTITRTGTTNAALTVNLGLAGTAASGADYQSVSTSVVVPSGATNATLEIRAIDDAAVTGNRTLVATIASSSAYVADSDSATITIVDNDTVPVFTMNDLIVTSLSALPASPVAGDRVRFTATVKNQGTVATPTNMTLALGFYVNGTLVSWVLKPSLAAGEIATFTAADGVSGVDWVAVGGTNSVLAHIDDSSQLGIPKTNNSMRMTLVVASTNAPKRELKIKLRRENSGSVAVSWDSEPSSVYQVYYKSTIVDWQPISSEIPATGTTTSFTDTPPTNSTMRLYKVAQVR